MAIRGPQPFGGITASRFSAAVSRPINIPNALWHICMVVKKKHKRPMSIFFGPAKRFCEPNCQLSSLDPQFFWSCVTKSAPPNTCDKHKQGSQGASAAAVQSLPDACNALPSGSIVQAFFHKFYQCYCGCPDCFMVYCIHIKCLNTKHLKHTS